jgi:hypothetical protein
MNSVVNRKFLLFLMVILLVVNVKNSWSQSAADLRFNEVLILNDSLNVDDYGQHSSWIEIFNSSFSNVDIGGCFLTDDPENPTKYWIPTGVPSTLIPPRCFVLFWADGKPSRGIYHLNFELRDAKTIALYDASGRTLIDQLDLNVPQQSNHSYGRINENTEDWQILEKITPAATNDYSRKASSGEKFVEMDPSGIGMTFIAMFVVFTSLALMYGMFSLTGNYFKRSLAKSKAVSAEGHKPADDHLSGEVSAAIAMALHLFQSEMHDEENTVLTIKKVSRTYSPWSSKIYTLRRNPR